MQQKAGLEFCLELAGMCSTAVMPNLKILLHCKGVHRFS